MSETTSQSGVLYHVTTAANLDSIYVDGVDPSYSKGKFEASWYVSKGQILWAICHVSLRHGVELDDIFVCPVLIEWNTMRRTNRPGRYYTQRTYKIENASPAAWYVDEET